VESLPGPSGWRRAMQTTMTNDSVEPENIRCLVRLSAAWSIRTTALVMRATRNLSSLRCCLAPSEPVVRSEQPFTQ